MTNPRQQQSIGTPGFAEETRRYLQRRLMLLTGSLGAILGALSVVFILQLIQTRGLPAGIVAFATGFPNNILAMLVVLSGGCYLALRLRPLSVPSLSVIDGLFLLGLVAGCLYLFDRLHFFSFSGFAAVVPFLSLFILARSVLVPSTPWRTLLFSLPAPLGVLLIQLRHGASYMTPGEAYSAAHFLESAVQNQVVLLGACAVAVVASRVNLNLRRSHFDARSVGQYQMGRKLGEGAMGEVYLATHAMLKRPTAIKLLQPKITGEAALRRFEREVRLTSRLSHPNTVSIFDYGHTADGLFYYAMEYLEGATLAEIVQNSGPLPPGRVIHVMSAACAALSEAHGKGLIHRDIKLANIMLCERGSELDVVKLLDFGLVQDLSDATRAEHSIMGTPETMAPEVILGREVGPAADLYALGAVGYTLLTGEPVFESLTIRQMLGAHQSQEPRPPSEWEPGIPSDLEGLILRCLSKEPGERPADAATLRDELLSCGAAGSWTRVHAAEWWTAYGRNPRVVDFDAVAESSDLARTIVAPMRSEGEG